jgi:hypothetical protein
MTDSNGTASALAEADSTRSPPAAVAAPPPRHGGVVVVAVVILVAVALILAVAVTDHPHVPTSSTRITPEAVSTFASVPNVTSLTVSPTQMFATSSPNCTSIWSIDSLGHVSLYATLPLPQAACGIGESGVVLAGVSPTAPPILFAAAEGSLFEITQGGLNVTLVAQFSTPADADMGLAYDPVGSFHHDLIVTGEAGEVWLYNLTTNTSSLLTHVHVHVEGPSIAPPGFGTYAGDLFLPAQLQNAVYAITPNGSTSKVVSWTEAESVSFFTGFLCTFGSNPGLLYVANQTAGIIQAYPASDFSGLVGEGFVDSEFHHGGIGSFDSTGSVSSFVANGEQLEQLAFVTPVGNSNCGNGG